MTEPTMPAWLVAAARRRLENTCAAESSVVMPPAAQRIHNRMHYTCGQVRGHDGPHRWPADTGRIAEWTDPA